MSQIVTARLARAVGTVLLGVLASCGGGNSAPAPEPPPAAQAPQPEPTPQPQPPDVDGSDTDDSCGVESQKLFAREVANDWYLWYSELADVDPADYDSVNAYLAALTAPLAIDGRDPGFSFMTTISQDEANFTSGAFVGFGFRYRLDADNNFYIADALEGGPAAEAGFARGVEVLAIDTGGGGGFETISALTARGVTSAELFGAAEAGVERGFRLRDGQRVFDVRVVKRELVTPPLAGDPLLIERPGNVPVGYFHLRSFTRAADVPLADAIAGFADAGVTDLVIDLRYNGGGLLSVAANLLDLLGGVIANGQRSFIIGHNEKRVAENNEAFFAIREQSMAPLRIAFITTESTASASELVINSMAPHADVVLVGDDTLGKAVGQYAFDQPDCDNRLRLVTFEILNGEAQGGYYTGLVDSGRFTLCAAADDVRRGFGDPGEGSLAVALDWLNAGSCPASTAKLSTPRQLSNRSAAGTLRPSWYPSNPVQPDRRSPLWQ